jgi:hypothetical protein
LIVWKRPERLAHLPGAIAAMLEAERNSQEGGYNESDVTEVLRQLQEDDAAVMSAADAEFNRMWQRISAPSATGPRP